MAPAEPGSWLEHSKASSHLTVWVPFRTVLATRYIETCMLGEACAPLSILQEVEERRVARSSLMQPIIQVDTLGEMGHQTKV